MAGSIHAYALVVTMTLAGCQPAQSNVTPAANRDRRPVTLIASGDTHGWFVPCGCTANQSGGLLRRATYLAQQRAAGAKLVVVDVGGAIDGTAPYQLEKFKSILAGERKMGIAAHNLGAAEIAFGAQALHELGSSLGVPFLSTNVLDAEGRAVAHTHLLLDVAGQKLLVTGVVSPRYSGPDLQVSEPADAILELLRTLNQPYDWHAVLAYLPDEELTRLAEKLPEADAVIGGPTGQSLPPQQLGRTLVTSATNKGKFLAEVTFPPSRQEQPLARIVEMSPGFADDKDQLEILRSFRKTLEQRDFSAQESGLLSAEQLVISANQTVAGTVACRECHQQTSEHWTTTGHAHAWDRLLAEGAQVDSYCQQCHTTGFGLAGGFVSANRSGERIDVGCESCHGPSQAHVTDNAVHTPFDAIGRCIKCHDPENSPAFEFASYWERVRHAEH